jgi:hypothetical protein
VVVTGMYVVVAQEHLELLEMNGHYGSPSETSLRVHHDLNSQSVPHV